MMIDSYKRLPLGMYLDILKLQRECEDDLERQVKVICLLSGKEEREVLNLPIGEYREMAGKTLFLTTAPERYGRPANKYTLGKWVLIPTMNLSKVTTAQYIDFQNFASKGESGLAETLSCFLVPEGKNYNEGYDVAEVHQAIKDYLMVSDALALMAFFLTRLGALMKVTKTSLSKLKKKMTEEQIARVSILTEAIGTARKVLQTGGVG